MPGVLLCLRRLLSLNYLWIGLTSDKDVLFFIWERKLTAFNIHYYRYKITLHNAQWPMWWVGGSFFGKLYKKKVRLSLPLLIGHSQLEIEFNLASIQEDKQGYGLRTERFKKLSKRKKVWFQVLTEKQTCKVFYIELFRPCPLPPWGQVPLLRFYLWL